MQKREVVLDTETTGVDPSSDRIVEIGCVELIGGMPSGQKFRRYINPQRAMPASAFLVHGISSKFLAGKPTFDQIADAFLGFIGDSDLIIHNAPFDLGFLNAELRLAGRPQISKDRVIDTLPMARNKWPGKPASLEAICKRLDISLAERKKHGALVDATLLAEVYLQLIGGRQGALQVASTAKVKVLPGISPAQWIAKLVQPSEEELTAHAAFIGTIKNAIWNRRNVS